MSFHFRPATRAAAKLSIGLVGPTGSGKTLSALKLATGLGSKVAVIDTERGRACQYASDYKFLHAELPPPFSPDRYFSICEEAFKLNPDVLVIDSLSHAWEGIGGVLDTVERAKQSGRQDMGIWAGPKQAHQRFVNLLLQSPCHIIVTMRGKEKKGMVIDPRTRKQEIVDLGWHPIVEKGLPFELTINVLLSAEKKGVPIVDGFDFGKRPYNMRELMPDNQPISEETGKAFAMWAGSGTPQEVTGTSAAQLLKQIEACTAYPELEVLEDLVKTTPMKDTSKDKLIAAIEAGRLRLPPAIALP